jgi:Fe2+ transport system protein B
LHLLLLAPPQVRTFGVPGLIVVIAANKADMRAQRQVTPDDVAAFADKHGAFVVETSAKTGAGIQDCFKQIAREAAKQMASGAPSEGFKIMSLDRRPLPDLDETEDLSRRRKAGCC